MRKPDLCQCENVDRKDVDQLCSICATDQLPSFHYMSLLSLNSKFYASSLFLRLYRLVCVGPGRKPR